MQASSISPDGGSAATSPAPPWLELPDPCLLAVLRCCAATDPRTLLSAARAHSRLRQAAAMVGLDSVQAVIGEQQQVDSLQLYLSKHGQHVASISVQGCDTLTALITLRELPANLPRLHSVSFAWLCLQLQPGHGHRGVLAGAAGAHLKRLELHNCVLLGGQQGLAAALAQLPRLEHLSNCNSYCSEEGMTQDQVQTRDVQAALAPGCSLQQLTYLELAAGSQLRSGLAVLRRLSAFTRLADLRLALNYFMIPASVLAGAQLHHLTHLQLRNCEGPMSVDPAVLTGRTQLQHLELRCGLFPDSAAGTARLLHHLQQLQQLTSLVIQDTLPRKVDSPPAAAYAALTASSKLRVLGIIRSPLPADVWQHVLPAGRQLPHLRALDVHGTCDPTCMQSLPDGSRLVSCCPGLQTLTLSDFLPAADLGALAQLTGLRELNFVMILKDYTSTAAEARLLQLSCLVQLTRLAYHLSERNDVWTLESQAPGDEPVWCQLLRRLLNSSNPEVAHKAAAGLAGLALEQQAGAQ